MNCLQIVQFPRNLSISHNLFPIAHPLILVVNQQTHTKSKYGSFLMRPLTQEDRHQFLAGFFTIVSLQSICYKQNKRSTKCVFNLDQCISHEFSYSMIVYENIVFSLKNTFSALSMIKDNLFGFDLKKQCQNVNNMFLRVLQCSEVYSRCFSCVIERMIENSLYSF